MRYINEFEVVKITDDGEVKVVKNEIFK